MSFFDKRNYEKILTAQIDHLPDLAKFSRTDEGLSTLSGLSIMALVSTYFIEINIATGIAIILALLSASILWIGYRAYSRLLNEKSKLYLPVINGNENLLRSLAVSRSFNLDESDSKFLIRLSKMRRNEISFRDLSRLRIILTQVRESVSSDTERKAKDVMFSARKATLIKKEPMRLVIT